MADQQQVGGERRGDQAPSASGPALARTIGLGALILYGVGDMLGAGIYATIGSVAATMGNAMWVAYATSLVAALLTGLSYASLGSRYPRAAGVAYITQRAYARSFLTYVVGLAVVASGLTSMGAQSRAFAGYFMGLREGVTGQVQADTSSLLWVGIVLAFIGVLTVINLRGIRESVGLTLLCTVVEAAGLVFIIAIGLRYWGGVNYLEVPVRAGQFSDVAQTLTLGLVLQGAVLTFYSFIGFEDMINITEEVKDPQRNFPKGVLGAVAIAAVIYMCVSITAVSVIPHPQLAASKQPLVDVVRRAAPSFPPLVFSLVALFAITNTALVNYIMGSRLIYGMARQGLVPRVLGTVHPTRHTPHYAILSLMVIVIALALFGDVAQLASATSVLLLSVFVIVNSALIVLQRRPDEPKGSFEIPSLVPAGGIVVCLTLLFNAKTEALLTAGMLLAGIVFLYLVMRPRNLTEESFANTAE